MPNNELGLYPIEFQARCRGDNTVTTSGECFYNPDLECWFVLHQEIGSVDQHGKPVYMPSWHVSEYSTGMRLGARAPNRREAMKHYLSKVAPLNAQSIRVHIERWGEPLNDVNQIRVSSAQ